jgi:hypothetical protein
MSSSLRKIALWITIVTLLAAGVMGGIFIVIGNQADVGGRSWLTFLLILAFAGAVALDANVTKPESHRYLFGSTITNVILMAIGVLKLWNGPWQPPNIGAGEVWAEQFSRWLGILFVLRISVAITQLYFKFFVTRAKLAATRMSGFATIVLVWFTAVVLVLPLSFPYLRAGGGGWPDWWGKLAGAAALVMAVCIVLPLVVRAFEPHPPAQPVPYSAAFPGGYPPPGAYPPPLGYEHQPGYPPPPGYLPPSGFAPEPSYGQAPGYPPAEAPQAPGS